MQPKVSGKPIFFVSDINTGRGRGRQVVSVAKTADLVILMSGSTLSAILTLVSRCYETCGAEETTGDRARSRWDTVEWKQARCRVQAEDSGRSK
jgi:hypothetical protein